MQKASFRAGKTGLDSGPDLLPPEAQDSSVGPMQELRQSGGSPANQGCVPNPVPADPDCPDLQP
jgi:hypothetical protein